jgi:hypothetical protein
MSEITRDNFESSYPQIVEVLKKADFIGKIPVIKFLFC